MDFKLCMLIPVTVRYDVEIVATLQTLQESPYVHLKHYDSAYEVVTL